MQQMEDDIKQKLNEIGFEQIEIKTIYAPAWTTDWLSDTAKTKLLNYGISPPEKTTSDKSALSLNPKKIICPKCKSFSTKLISQFGSTACKALYQCEDCFEAFDYFKCI
jgi:ring-1,2-phenylacetyl-CoA epoxidase subunit PaaD